MSTYAESLRLSIRRQHGILKAAAGAGFLLGFVAWWDGRLEAAPGAAIYLGCFFTLALTARMVALSFKRVPGEHQAAPALRRLYLWQVGQATLLAGMARGLMTLGLLPFLWDAQVSTAMSPVVMGWPMDVLLVTMAVSLAAALGVGGTALAFALALLFGALGEQAMVDPEAFGAFNALLRATAFPWTQLQTVQAALGAGDLATLAAGTARLIAYWTVWAALGLGALTWRARRAGDLEAELPAA